MSLEKNIERIADALEKIAASAGVTVEYTQTEEKPAEKEKPAAKKKEKPEPKAEKQEAPEEDVTFEQVKQAFIKLYGKDMDSATDFLADYGIEKLSGLAEDKFAEAFDKLKELLGA